MLTTPLIWDCRRDIRHPPPKLSYRGRVPFKNDNNFRGVKKINEFVFVTKLEEFPCDKMIFLKLDICIWGKIAFVDHFPFRQ